jgi:16S rRNA processing protein RimM
LIDQKEYLRIGKILGVHGLHGRLKVLIITDVPGRFSPGSGVYLEKKGAYELHTVEECAGHKGRVALVKLAGITERDAAEALKGREIFIEKAAAAETREDLEDGSFYYYELIGSTAFVEGKAFGKVVDIVEAGSGNILVIRGPLDKEYMVPFVETMVDTKALRENRIDIFPVEGLFD